MLTLGNDVLFQQIDAAVKTHNAKSNDGRTSESLLLLFFVNRGRPLDPI